MRTKVIGYLKENKIDISGNDIYEFGIYSGESMVSIQNGLKAVGLVCNSIYCFDSFGGLPEEEGNLPRYETWFKGNYSAKEAFQENDIHKIIEILKSKVSFSPILTYFIPGFFEKSLNKALLKKYSFKKAIYIDVDVDLYKSAKECLEFMFKNKLVQVGTLIGYDDWSGTKEFEGGESLAHKEMTEKYNIRCKELFYLGPIRKVFEVSKIA